MRKGKGKKDAKLNEATKPKEEEVIKIEVTEEVIADNPDLAEEVVVGDTIEITPIECGDDCECHSEPKLDNVEFELKEDGIYLNGEVCVNPVKVYNHFHAKIDEMFHTKSVGE